MKKLTQSSKLLFYDCKGYEHDINKIECNSLKSYKSENCQSLRTRVGYVISNTHFTQTMCTNNQLADVKEWNKRVFHHELPFNSCHLSCASSYSSEPVERNRHVVFHPGSSHPANAMAPRT